MMQESFLHFLWQYQYFEPHRLKTTENETVEILNRGIYNTNAGADFEHAHVKIDQIEWQGDVEIHIKASDWQKHQHQNNERYNRVVLHVVWENDIPIKRADGSLIPTLELKNYVKSNIFHQYKYLSENQKDIPCEALIFEVEPLYWFMMMDKALIQRLEKKADLARNIWLSCEKDWEETTYRLLAQNFGFKINSHAFLRLAEQTPLKYILKHRDNLTQIEALLFGQAGFLEGDTQDTYFETLQKEYKFLKVKYQLDSIEKSEWNFLRLRPANFPTIRLAQFAQLLHKNANLFSVLLYAEQFKTLKRILDADVSEYWQSHYQFGNITQEKAPSKLGKGSIENIVINTIVPLMVLYSQESKRQDLMDKAIDFLEKIPAEINHIIEKWQKLGANIKNSADSQALIEQYNTSCSHKKCLECTIGVNILGVKNKQAILKE
jgi:uncharacterized protein YciU (UPF0263 family)